MMLLTTKLIPPRIPTVLVVRDRLLQQLDAALSHRLTLLSASAGSGKTTLLSAWAAATSHAQAQGPYGWRPRWHGQQEAEYALAWLSLDELDNDPPRFWASVIAALHTCLPQ